MAQDKKIGIRIGIVGFPLAVLGLISAAAAGELCDRQNGALPSWFV